MKKLYLFLIILCLLFGVQGFGSYLFILYHPTGIPFEYDPNAVDYKLLGGIDVRAGQEVIVDVNCYDPDGDPFTIEVLNWQAGMNCTNGTSWRLIWRPTALQEGLHYINVEAKDVPPDPNDALSDRGTLVFNVRPRNRPPILLPCGG